MADDCSFYAPFAAFCTRDNYDDVFRDALENLAVKVDLSHVKSCVAFGTGSGEQEMKFAKRLMTKLQSFIAVEEDCESVKALQASVRMCCNAPVYGISVKSFSRSLLFRSCLKALTIITIMLLSNKHILIVNCNGCCFR